MIKAADISVMFSRGLFRRKLKALDGFSMNIEKGDVYALLGPNGAGKSTAMYCFLGLIKPDKGSVKVLGETPSAGSRLFDRMAYLPEEPHYHDYLTVEEAVGYYSKLYRTDIPGKKIEEVIETVKLTDFKDLKISNCSKGMKQKVGIAACLTRDVDLLFLDEPTRGLDPIIVKDFRDILISLNERGTTIVLNSHMLSEIEMVCNRAAIINKGRVIAEDDLQNFMKFDLEHYSVRFDCCDNVPDFIAGGKVTGNIMSGEICVSALRDFMDFATDKGLKIYSCSLKRMTLEDVFINVLESDSHD